MKPLLLLALIAAQDKPLTPEQLREEEAYTIGVQAYIYGYPVVEMYRTRYLRVYHSTSKLRTPINQFRHVPILLDHRHTDVVSPNNDTLYSAAWLDLAREPLILHLPDMKGRYHIFQLLDFYTNNAGSLGKRTTGTSAGDFALVGPAWKGTLPAGVKRVDCPTNAAWLIGRTLVDGPADLPAVHKLQEQYTLTPLSAWGKTNAPRLPEKKTDPPPYDLSEPLNFFAILNTALRENPPPKREAALMSLFGRIGVGPDQTFGPTLQDAAAVKGLQRALKVGNEMITGASKRLRSPVDGWLWPPKGVGNFGDDYLLRAETARTALASLSPEDAVYISGVQDAQGQAFSGKHRYVLRFEKGQLPPVDGFWSVTMYRMPERLLAANALGRYSIGDRTAGLRTEADGSLEILIQHESPGKDRESNWLPAPPGEFSLMMRAYVPRRTFLDRTWKLPPVKRID